MPDFAILIIVAVLIFVAKSVGKAFKGGFESMIEQFDPSGSRPTAQGRRIVVPARPAGVGPPPDPARRPGRPAVYQAGPIAAAAQSVQAHPMQAKPVQAKKAPAHREQQLERSLAHEVPEKELHCWDDPETALDTSASAKRAAERETRLGAAKRPASRFVRGLQAQDIEKLQEALVLSEVLGPPAAIKPHDPCSFD